MALTEKWDSKMMIFRKCLCILAGIFLSFSAFSQSSFYPSQPVKFIVTFTPGGAADLTARIIGDYLSRLWGQQVVVENKIGAGGSIGVEQVFRAKPDGYTLLLASNTHAINQALYSNLPFDLKKDFFPVASLTSSPIALAVNSKVSVKNLKEFTALLRSQPDKIAYATCGIATAHHFAMELYKHATNTIAIHIPEKGCTPAVLDAVSGQVDVVISSLATVLPFAKDQKLRIIGLTSRDRSTSIPEAVPFRESGVPELSNYDVENYYGLLAQSAVPKEILSKLEVDLKKAVETPEVKNKLAVAGLDVFWGQSAQFSGLISSDIEKFKRAIQIANIKPE